MQEEEDPARVAELAELVERIVDQLDGKQNSDCMVAIANVVTRFCNDQDDPDGAFLRFQEMMTIVYRKVRSMRLANDKESAN